MTLGEDLLTDWLVSYLGGDSTLAGMLNGGIYPEVQPNSAASPFVRMDRLEQNDLMVVGLFRVWTDTQWHIYGCQSLRSSDDPVDRSDINAIGARLDQLLHDHEYNDATMQIHSFREEGEPNPTAADPAGGVWLQSGGIYRIRITAL